MADDPNDDDYMGHPFLELMNFLNGKTAKTTKQEKTTAKTTRQTTPKMNAGGKSVYKTGGSSKHSTKSNTKTNAQKGNELWWRFDEWLNDDNDEDNEDDTGLSPNVTVKVNASFGPPSPRGTSQTKGYPTYKTGSKSYSSQPLGAGSNQTTKSIVGQIPAKRPSGSPLLWPVPPGKTLPKIVDYDIDDDDDDADDENDVEYRDVPQHFKDSIAPLPKTRFSSLDNAKNRHGQGQMNLHKHRAANEGIPHIITEISERCVRKTPQNCSLLQKEVSRTGQDIAKAINKQTESILKESDQRSKALISNIDDFRAQLVRSIQHALDNSKHN